MHRSLRPEVPLGGVSSRHMVALLPVSLSPLHHSFSDTESLSTWTQKERLPFRPVSVLSSAFETEAVMWEALVIILEDWFLFFLLEGHALTSLMRL